MLTCRMCTGKQFCQNVDKNYSVLPSARYVVSPPLGAGACRGGGDDTLCDTRLLYQKIQRCTSYKMMQVVWIGD